MNLLSFFIVTVTVLCDTKSHHMTICNNNSDFFLNQQFITWHVKADRGSYFRNYVHERQTNRKLEDKRKKRKEELIG